MDISFDDKVIYSNIGSKNIEGEISSVSIGKESCNITIPMNVIGVKIGDYTWHVNISHKNNADILKNVTIDSNNEGIKLIVPNGGANDCHIGNISKNTYTWPFADKYTHNIELYDNIKLTNSRTISTIKSKGGVSYGSAISYGDNSFSNGNSISLGTGSFTFGDKYSNNYERITINSVSYEKGYNSKKEFTHVIATCEYTKKSNSDSNAKKGPVVGCGISGTIGYITEITTFAEKNNSKGIFKFYIPTVDIVNNTTAVPSQDIYKIKTGTQYQYNSNCAVGKSSFAGGVMSSAMKDATFAMGVGVTTTNNAEVALGEYNVSNENTLFSLGKGTNNISRKNAFDIIKSDKKYSEHPNDLHITHEWDETSAVTNLTIEMIKDENKSTEEKTYYKIVKIYGETAEEDAAGDFNPTGEIVDVEYWPYFTTIEGTNNGRPVKVGDYLYILKKPSITYDKKLYNEFGEFITYNNDITFFVELEDISINYEARIDDRVILTELDYKTLMNSYNLLYQKVNILENIIKDLINDDNCNNECLSEIDCIYEKCYLSSI